MLKKALTLCFLSAAFLFTSCSPESFQGKFSTEPAKPMPSEEVLVRYVADSTNLAGSESIDMIVYSYDESVYKTEAITMEAGKEGWFAPFSTADSTRGVIIKFKSEEKIDNNNKKGYVVYMYEGNNPVSGAKAGHAAAMIDWGRYTVDMERDPENAYKLFQEEFEENPSVKEDYYEPYFRTVSMHMKEKGNNVIENELENISQKDKLNEEELAVLCTWYSRINKPEKIEQFESKLKKLNPNNEYFARQELQKFRSLSSIDKKIEFINELKEKGTDHEMLDAMINEVAYRYQQSGDFEKGWEFIQDNKEKTHPYRFYSYANGLLESNKNLSLAEEIAEAGVEKARKFYEDPEEEKPKTKTQEEWKDDRAYFLGNNLYAYGKLLLNKGNNSEALEKLEEAVKLSDRSNVDFNEYYAKALMETDRNQKVLGELKNFIKSGTANSKMRNMYKEAYVAVNGSEEGLKESLGELTSAADEKMTAELEEKMINKPAPNFTLTDLEGNKVSLNDYQGKTVVVDFWATWCGPCLQSFPGMKKAVQKYQDNKDVKFLFVNTWENVDDKKSNARQFIKKNDYPFHVLLDTENKVVTEFKVSGIPTKYIIDSSGNIRFKSVGFSGNTEHLVKELEVMIDLTKANS